MCQTWAWNTKKRHKGSYVDFKPARRPQSQIIFLPHNNFETCKYHRLRESYLDPISKVPALPTVPIIVPLPKISVASVVIMIVPVCSGSPIHVKSRLNSTISNRLRSRKRVIPSAIPFISGYIRCCTSKRIRRPFPCFIYCSLVICLYVDCCYIRMVTWSQVQSTYSQSEQENFVLTFKVEVTKTYYTCL
jgi:hypothetical protein